MDYAIRAQHLCKTFRVHKREAGLAAAIRSTLFRKYATIKAVDDISFDVKRGEVVGFIGPNGAGKSTAIKMLIGVLKSDSGKVEVLGFRPFEQRKQLVKRIGVVFGQKTQLWWDLPAIDTLRLMKDIYDVPQADWNARYEMLDGILGLDEFIRSPVRKLSLGQRMRAEIAAALLHGPELILLDEPTVGVDVVGKERIRGFIAGINKRLGTTVLLTSHDMFDVEKLCKRVVIIDFGRIVYDGSLETLREKYVHRKRITLTFSMPVAEKTVSRLGYEWKKRTDTTYSFWVPKKEVPDFLEGVLAGFRIVDIKVEEPGIDAVIADIFRHKGAGA